MTRDKLGYRGITPPVMRVGGLKAVLILIGLIVVSNQGCSNGNEPILFSIPEGLFYRSSQLSADRELHTWLHLRRDSASMYDTVFIDDAGSLTVDSTHSVELELNPSGDGYYRAVEEHRTNGTDNVDDVLRYWYFFERVDSVYFLRGMRLRGNNSSIVGRWRVSSADSAYMHESLTYEFSDDSVTVTRRAGSAAPAVTTAHYSTSGRTLNVHHPSIPSFGTRFEIVPGLALYLTSHADKGYRRVTQ